MISRPKFLKKYLCIRRFEAQSGSELSLKVGQVVELIEKDRSGWWLVYSYDRKGYVPGSHLIPMDTDDNGGGAGTEAASELCIAVKGYNARRPDELSLLAGSYVEIISKSEDGWWMVRTVGENSVAGRYPALYLKSMLNNNEKVSNKGSNLPRSNSKRAAFFNLPITRKQSARNSRSVDVPRNSVHFKACSSQYFALDHHDDIYGDSLSFQRGDEVTVLHKTNTGWWYVSIKGREGWAPSSYLTQQAPAVTTPPSVLKVVTEYNGTPSERSSRADTQAAKIPSRGVRKTEIYSWQDNGYMKARESARRAEEGIVNAALNDFTTSVMHELKAKLSNCNGHQVERDSQSQGSAENKSYALVAKRQQKKIKWI